MQVMFDIPLGDGKARAHARLFSSGTDYGLTLHDGSGKPAGKGRSLSQRQALSLAKAIEEAKPHMRVSLIWAALGYERITRKAVASAMCHPGSIRLHGRP